MAKLSVKRFSSRDEAERHYLREIDRLAEAARTAIITAAPGQSMTYEDKYREALAGGGTFLAAEAEALGVSEQAVIDSVLAARKRWESMGPRIEAARLKAKRRVRRAQAPAEMHAAAKLLSAELAT